MRSFCLHRLVGLGFPLKSFLKCPFKSVIGPSKLTLLSNFFSTFLFNFSVFARLPDRIAAKLIYDRRWILAESGDGCLDYKNEGSFINFFFGDEYLSVKKRDGEPPAFVVEQVYWNSSQTKDHDCKNEVDPLLQKYLFKCQGYLRVRQWTKEEHEQMVQFINDPGMYRFCSKLLIVTYNF